MSPEKLIYMANQIARSFNSRPKPEAIQATAKHISNFWEPRMRSQLFSLMDEDVGRFDPTLREARSGIRPVKS